MLLYILWLKIEKAQKKFSLLFLPLEGQLLLDYYIILLNNAQLNSDRTENIVFFPRLLVNFKNSQGQLSFERSESNHRAVYHCITIFSSNHLIESCLATYKSDQV